MLYKCCVPKCDSIRQNAKLHRLPVQQEFRRRWIKCINSENLRNCNNKHVFVCHKHFEKRFINPVSNRLYLKAYPTLFTASEIASGVSTNISLETEKVKNICIEHNYTRKQHFDHLYALPFPTENTSDKDTSTQDLEPTSTVSTVPKLANIAPKPAVIPDELDPLALDVKSEHEDSDTELQYTEEPVYDETIEEDVSAEPLADDLKDGNKTNFNRPLIKLMNSTLPSSVIERWKLDNQKQVDTQLQRSDGAASLTNLTYHEIVNKHLLIELEIYKNKNLALRKEMSTLRKRNRYLEKRLANLKCLKKDKKAMFDKLTINMSAPAKALFEMQLQTKKKMQGRRYSLPGRIIALSIYKASPACYALLSKYFVLPSRTVMKRLVASVRQQTAAAETNVTRETDPNEPENEEDQDMLLDEDKTDGIEDLDLNDYNIDNTFQQEINETSEVVDHIVNEIQAITKEPQSSQAAEDMHQMTDDTSEVQSVELCEGQALQLADGRIFQLIDGQIVEVVGELKQDELNVLCDETRSTGSIALLSETPLPQDNVSSTRQTIIDHYQRSHRDTSPHPMAIKTNSFDERPANVDELCISNPLRSQVGEQATQIKHPHRTEHQQTTKETSSSTNLSQMFTRPVTSLKRVATDEEQMTSPARVTELNRVHRNRKRLKTKQKTDRGPDMPDLTFS